MTAFKLNFVKSTFKEDYQTFYDFYTYSCFSSLRKHTFLLALRRWGRFVSFRVFVSRETSPAAKSEEKRMFSQANAFQFAFCLNLLFIFFTFLLFLYYIFRTPTVPVFYTSPSSASSPGLQSASSRGSPCLFSPCETVILMGFS